MHRATRPFLTPSVVSWHPENSGVLVLRLGSVGCRLSWGHASCRVTESGSGAGCCHPSRCHWLTGSPFGVACRFSDAALKCAMKMRLRSGSGSWFSLMPLDVVQGRAVFWGHRPSVSLPHVLSLPSVRLAPGKSYCLHLSAFLVPLRVGPRNRLLPVPCPYPPRSQRLGLWLS